VCHFDNTENRATKLITTISTEEHHHHGESMTYHHKKKNGMAARAGVIILLLLIAGAVYYFKNYYAVAYVNGTPITRMELNKELSKRYGKQTIDVLVNRAIIEQEARKKNIKISDKEVNDEISKIEKSVNAQGQKLDSLLAMQGMDRESFKSQMKLQKTVDKLIGDSVKVSDKEIEDYMTENKIVSEEGNNGAKVKENVKDQLKQQKMNEAFQQWLVEQKKKVKISYNGEFSGL
jgi:parvulin-like peptidyl-prolyl isomerase